jgi:phage portal protein BeeE
MRERSITTLDDYAAALNELIYNGNVYGFGGIQQTGTQGQAVERIGNDLQGFATSAYAANGIVFAVMAVRMAVFSAIRFQWQQMSGGRPSTMFGRPDLARLEKPWVGGTTQGLLTRMIQDADLAGNSYWVNDGDELVRMRPDWVQIVLEKRMMATGQVGWKRLGYAYFEGGMGGTSEPAVFLPQEIIHFAPTPDPLATYRGMSWLTPVLREITNDKAMNRHKSKFFENGATPNLVASLDKSIPMDKFMTFAEKMNAKTKGVENAYKTLYLGGGADVKVIGSDFQQMDFKVVQGHGETRIAAAGGVPPVIVGLSEGLEAATYSNYAQARRRFADGTMHPLWQDAAGSIATVMPSAPTGVRLWYDARDVPFLREDKADEANIQNKQASTIKMLIDAGYKPATVSAAVDANDWSLLEHTGLFSVQLRPAGADDPAATDTTGLKASEKEDGQ